MIGAKINLNGELIPDGWSVQLVGEVGEYINGFAFKPSDWHDSGVPIIRIQNLNDTRKPYNYYPGQIDEKYRVRTGDILISWSASLGTYLWRGDDAWLNQHIFKAIPDETKIERDFFYWAMVYAIDRIAKNARGSTMVHVTGKEFRESEFLLPPRSEQQTIAGVLGLVHQRIEQQERLLTLTAELKKSLLNQLFTRGLRNEPQKQTDLGPLPNNWKVQELGELSTQISKGSSPRWQGFAYQQDGVLFVRSQNVGQGRLDFKDHVFVPAAFNEHEKRSILKNEDILINLVGASIGRVAFGTSKIEGANCNQAVAFVRMDSPRSFKEFLVWFLLSPAGQQQMFFQKKDIARANLSLLDLKAFKVPVPPIEESEEIAQAFCTIECILDVHHRKRVALHELFRTLLYELMTARIRVNDLDL